MDTNQILDLFLQQKWLALSAITIGLIVRSLKDDTIGPVVPARLRPWLALLLGGVAATINKVAAGGSWKESAILGLGAPTLAILGHVLGIESIRGDVEIPIPFLMKKSSVATSTTVVLIGVIMGLYGCSGTFEVSRSPRVALGAEAPARDVARCNSLDSASSTWGAIGKGSAALGGVAGLSTIAVTEEGLRTGLAITAVSLAGTAVGELYLSDRKTTSWIRECQ